VREVVAETPEKYTPTVPHVEEHLGEYAQAIANLSANLPPWDRDAWGRKTLAAIEHQRKAEAVTVEAETA
jgi:hypothetical protein